MLEQPFRCGARVEAPRTSQVLQRGPGKLTFIGCSAVTGNSSFLLYDGVDANGRLIGTFRCIADDSHMSNINPGLQFNNGLYIALTDGNIEPSIGFLPDDI